MDMIQEYSHPEVDDYDDGDFQNLTLVKTVENSIFYLVQDDYIYNVYQYRYIYIYFNVVYIYMMQYRQKCLVYFYL